MTNRDLTLFWIISLLCAIVRGFNIDTESPVVRAGPEGSMFGFDVSVHRLGDVGWMLVGAPKAETAQVNIEQGGAVFRCRVDGDDDCIEVQFDSLGNALALNPFTNQYEPVEEKSHQWFGASVKSSGRDGDIIACAPRYAYFTENFNKIEPVGNCFSSRSDFSRFSRHSPCRRSEEDVKWNKLGRCQAGYSVEITKDKRFILIGTVGSYYWQGQLHAEDLVYDVMSFTPEQGQEYDNRYLGYSMAVGQFTNDYFEDYVVGAPKGNDLKGLVHIYDGRSTLNRPFRQISGEQLGSYFGSTVAATDVNGDGLDDVIVGAPYYSDRESANEKWEAGRVYVFYQDPNYDYGEPTRLTGMYSSGRFGSDVAAIGDVNQDGYNDIAVGGPYDGVNGNGAVYVYHGSAEGIRTQPAQVITPGDIMQNLTTFGSSLSGGLDMDNNQYPDILVGAYGSDHAVLLRSRPVVNVEPTVTINPEFIDLEKKTCAKADGTPVACFDLTTCFKHTGVNVPVALELSFTTVLDTAKEHQKRAYFQATTSTKHTEVIKLEAPDQKWCAYTKIFLRDVFTDQYTPIAMEMTYELVENGATVGPNGLTPVLNQYDPLKVKTQAYIQNNCGDDRICIPDLKLDAKIDADEIYLGSTEPVKLIVDLTNNGEDAFEWEVVVQLPHGFDYDGKEKLDNTEYVISCVHVREETGMTLYCNTESGKPLQTNHRVLFALTLSTARMKESNKEIDVVITTNSTNPEEPSTMQDNVVYQSLPVKVAADVSFTGYSVPERITYKPRPLSPDFLIEHEDDIGPEVNHVYEVRNLGPSAIDGARIEIHWPAYTPNGEHLLYLLDVQLLGGSACDTHGILNPENVKTNGVVVTTNMTKRATVIRAERHRRAENLEKAKFSVDCKSAKCIPIVCNVDFALKTDEVANVQIRARLWKDTLIKAGHDETDIRSVANVEVNSMPYNIVPDYFPSGEAEILSIALPVKPKARTLPVPIWVIIVAIICGLLILALIIFVMWKTGFFKRKRVQDNYKEDAQNKTNDGVATKSEIVGKTEKSPPPVAL